MDQLEMFYLELRRYCHIVNATTHNMTDCDTNSSAVS